MWGFTFDHKENRWALSSHKKLMSSYCYVWQYCWTIRSLQCSHQKINAALAIALASEFESQSDSSSGIDRSSQIRKGILPDTYADGLRIASWPGRCQVSLSKQKYRCHWSYCWHFCACCPAFSSHEQILLILAASRSTCVFRVIDAVYLDPVFSGFAMISSS